MSARILVVEDEVLIALDLAAQLSDAGFDVVGPAGSVAKALTLLNGHGCDAAVLDVNLGKETAEAVAVVLRERGTPFVVLSGNSREHQAAVFQDAPFFSKPALAEALVAKLRDFTATA
jgi:DNA-binding response OmpR family regulator